MPDGDGARGLDLVEPALGMGRRACRDADERGKNTVLIFILLSPVGRLRLCRPRSGWRPVLNARLSGWTALGGQWRQAFECAAVTEQAYCASRVNEHYVLALLEMTRTDQSDQAGHAFARVDGVQQDGFSAAVMCTASIIASVEMPYPSPT